MFAKNLDDLGKLGTEEFRKQMNKHLENITEMLEDYCKKNDIDRSVIPYLSIASVEHFVSNHTMEMLESYNVNEAHKLFSTAAKSLEKSASSFLIRMRKIEGLT
jgi:hypothetical protein